MEENTQPATVLDEGWQPRAELLFSTCQLLSQCFLHAVPCVRVRVCVGVNKGGASGIAFSVSARFDSATRDIAVVST